MIRPAIGVLTVNAGQTLRIRKFSDVGPVQVFGGVGDVIFESGAVEYVLPQWWANNDVHKAAYSLKECGGIVQLLAQEYSLTKHTIQIEAGVASDACVHLWPGTRIRGVGMYASRMKVAAGHNCTAIRSWNFKKLTGTGAWTTAQGVPSDVGLEECSLDGNKANNTAGSGVEFYARMLTFDKVYVHDAPQNGVYCEAGDGGTTTEWLDAIQGKITTLVSAFNGGTGLVWKGPHDFHANALNLFHNGEYGLETSKTENEHAGKIEVDWMHTFQNVKGESIGHSFTGGIITFEGKTVFPGSTSGDIYVSRLKVSAGNNSDFDDNILTINANRAWIGELDVLVRFHKDATYYYGVHLGGDNIHIDSMHFEAAEGVAFEYAGVKIAGIRCHIGKAYIKGNAFCNSVGLDVAASYAHVEGTVEGFRGGGKGIGLRIGKPEAVNGCNLKVDTRNNRYALHYVSKGDGNRLAGHLYVESEQALLHPQCLSPNNTDDWDLYAYLQQGDQARFTKQYKQGPTFDIGSTGVRTVTVPHQLFYNDNDQNTWYAPLHKIIPTIILPTAHNFVATVQVVSINASEITFKVNVSSAASAGSNARLGVYAMN